MPYRRVSRTFHSATVTFLWARNSETVPTKALRSVFHANKHITPLETIGTTLLSACLTRHLFFWRGEVTCVLTYRFITQSIFAPLGRRTGVSQMQQHTKVSCYCYRQQNNPYLSPRCTDLRKPREKGGKCPQTSFYRALFPPWVVTN